MSVSGFGLTARQADALDCIKRHIGQHGEAPVLTEIAAALGLKSKTSALRLVVGLEERGAIHRRRLHGTVWPRGIRVIFPINGQPYRFIPKSKAA